MQRGAKPKYEPPEITIERESFVIERRISKRETYPEIAKQFAERFGESISEAQISRILKKHREYYDSKNADLIAQERAEQDALLNWAINQSVKGWKSSRKERQKKVKTVETGTDPRSGNEYDKTIEVDETEVQAGDPRFLKTLIDASTRKAKLWGLDAAPKSPKSDEDGDGSDPAQPWRALAEAINASRERIKQEDEEPTE